MDVIFAEATPPGRGGVSVIRVSGDGARAMAETLVGPLPVARRAFYRDLAELDEQIDQVLAIRFEAGASFTGEEVVELHLHGAPVVVRRVSTALQRAGARPAEAGEFTKRAFLNGRMDLAEVEGLGDLLAAETESQRRLALRTANGELARKAEHWRALLIEAGALVEASIDFADEDVPEDVPDRAFELIDDLKKSLEEEIRGFSAAERIRVGFEVAIIGPPNAGKSSLINKLARRDVALVSHIAGTTRDVIELRLELNGLAVTVLDTAGLRQSDDVVEAAGVSRAEERARAADLRVHLSDDGQPFTQLWQDGDIAVTGRADRSFTGTGLALSSLTGMGVDELLAAIGGRLQERVVGAGVVSHERQRAELEAALLPLQYIRNLPAELVAEALRQANSSLDRLVGRIGAEDYLEIIFSSFCIGK